jgi:hypothetical protein
VWCACVCARALCHDPVVWWQERERAAVTQALRLPRAVRVVERRVGGRGEVVVTEAVEREGTRLQVEEATRV